jgi:hypothetical protein
MDPFSSTYKDLAVDFDARGIPYDSPGFCDHPSFLAVERGNPDYLNHYAAFVVKRNYDPDYLARAKVVIEEAAAFLGGELVKHGRLGACVDMAGIFSRILEEERIWSCCVTGSLTIAFPHGSGIATRYFCPVYHGSFVAGHAWLYAPPFTIVDITVRQQPYRGKEKHYIPERVLTTDDTPADVDVHDIVSPSARAELLANGIPPHLHLQKTAPFIPQIFAALPAVKVSGLSGASLKYSPVAIHAPEGKLAGMTNMTFGGLTPWQLYRLNLAGKWNAASGWPGPTD